MKKSIFFLMWLLIITTSSFSQGIVDGGMIQYCTNLIETNIIDISPYRNIEKQENPTTNLWTWLSDNIEDYKYHDVTSLYVENKLGRTWVYENKTNIVYNLDNKLFIRNEQGNIIHYVDKLIVDKLNETVTGICCRGKKKKSYPIDYSHVKGRESLLIWIKRFKDEVPLKIIPDNKLINNRETELWIFFNNSKEYRFYLDKYYRLPIQVEIDTGKNPTKYYKYINIEVNKVWNPS